MKKINSILILLALIFSTTTEGRITAKDSYNIPIFKNTIPRGRRILFSICCEVKTKTAESDTSESADLTVSENEPFLRTIFVTAGTKFYFATDKQEQLEYNCEPIDHDRCDVRWISSAWTELSKLSVDLYCKDKNKELENITGTENARIELMLMKGSIHINGTGKKVSCDGE